MATRTDERSDQRTKVRAKDRVVPERSAEFDHLALSTLRTYRQTLTAEENRVSYWRRLIHARLDLIDMNGADDSIRLERLRVD